jgi:hypothetical protein
VSSSYCSGQLDPRRVLYGFHWSHSWAKWRFLVSNVNCFI